MLEGEKPSPEEKLPPLPHFLLYFSLYLVFINCAKVSKYFIANTYRRNEALAY